VDSTSGDSTLETRKRTTQAEAPHGYRFRRRRCTAPAEWPRGNAAAPRDRPDPPLPWSRMQLVYVDESGDPGGPTPAALAQGTSRHFILSSVAIDEGDWLDTLDGIAQIRGRMLAEHALPPNTELHAREILFPNDLSPFRLLRNRARRVDFLREFARATATMLRGVTVASVVIDKHRLPHGTPVLEHAWSLLCVHIDDRMRRDGCASRALMLSDEANEPRIRSTIRRLRRGLPALPGLEPPPQATTRILEDPVLRQSHHSFPIQLADAVAYALYQHRWPKGSLRRYGASNIYAEFEPLFDDALKFRGGGAIDGVIEA